jgi:hypothetical protein
MLSCVSSAVPILGKKRSSCSMRLRTVASRNGLSAAIYSAIPSRSNW